ncbi:MAG: hypothetical protein ACD_29C00119G0001 [uncultured bacterium]|nr:MAG: hypothetical protein ACD_29C00119G0001 [uncultured bacterium]OGT49127.1 MAG: hypothetical protein A3E53_06340 [Gammaproteobacteria bacterium RIFCSPHIGHO2_12_FULL_39_24]
MNEKPLQYPSLIVVLEGCMLNQPDYDFFLKLDKWTKKDAALILCGCDPAKHRNLRFSQDGLPDDLIASQKLYRIFFSVNFIKKYGRDNYPLNGRSIVNVRS